MPHDKRTINKVTDRLLGRNYKLVKHHLEQCGQYVHREVGFTKSHANFWFARSAPAHLNLPVGLRAKTARELMILIDQCLDKQTQTENV